MLKIGVFGYNFPHWKTQAGLVNLCVAGFDPTLAMLQEKKKLNVPQSEIRIAPRDLYLNHPRDVCDRLGVLYWPLDHDNPHTCARIEEADLDLGIVLGARILKKETIESFNIGVLNMHPGLIPLNRGLDNVKWAIIDGLKQGVTAHLIDEQVDMGAILYRQVMPVYPDDTLVDLHIRIQNLEQAMMIDVLGYYDNGGIKAEVVTDRGTYYREVPPEKEATLHEVFESYKANYASMRKE